MGVVYQRQVGPARQLQLSRGLELRQHLRREAFAPQSTSRVYLERKDTRTSGLKGEEILGLVHRELLDSEPEHESETCAG